LPGWFPGSRCKKLKIMQAQVKYQANDPKPTRQGKMRINAVISLPDGTETTFWGDPGDKGILALRKGQPVEVYRDKKGMWQLSADPTASAPYPAAQPLPPGPATTSQPKVFAKPSKELRQNMLEYIEFAGKLYKHCFDSVSDEMKDAGLKDEAVKDIATTLFISITRKFNLQ
jgi:hypothetical protein